MSLKPTNATYAPIEALVDEIARCGVEHAVASPGSRNAPVLLGLAREARIRTWSVLDERSAGFMALGIAKATGRPVVVTCTSGTAAANLLPAVVEAREARVPLIVLTADRPPELREVGAGQSIDQIKLFGPYAKWFVEVGNHPPGRASAVHHRALACRAWATATGGRPGPVHLNLPLREPLAPVIEELDASDWEGRRDGRPWVEVAESPSALDEGALGELARTLSSAARGAIVCGPTASAGPHAEAELAAAAAELAAVTGWPLLAEPTGGARCGEHDRSNVIAHYDVPLRGPRWAGAHRPDLVLRIGDTPTSKPLRAWLAEASEHVVIDPHAVWHEPTRVADRVLVADPAATCRALAYALAAPRGAGDAPAPPGREPSSWLEDWRRADALVPRALAALPDPLEPKAHVAFLEALPPGASAWISSSMPIRDVEAYLPALERPLRLLANRGANGIDGVVSSALGAAAAARGHAYLVTGELALLHDVGALVAARRLGLSLTILCVNNGGGGIFDFLPVAAHADPGAYEELVATPSGVDLERLAHGLGFPHTLARTPAEVAAAATEPGLIEVRTNRADNVALHRELVRRVVDELETGTR